MPHRQLNVRASVKHQPCTTSQSSCCGPCVAEVPRRSLPSSPPAGWARAGGVQLANVTPPVPLTAECLVVTGNPGQSQGPSCPEICVTTEKGLMPRASLCEQWIESHCALYMSGEKYHPIFHFGFCYYSWVILPLTLLAVCTEWNTRSIKSLHVCSWIILIIVSQFQVKIFSFPWKKNISVPKVTFYYEDGFGWLVSVYKTWRFNFQMGKQTRKIPSYWGGSLKPLLAWEIFYRKRVLI